MGMNRHLGYEQLNVVSFRFVFDNYRKHSNLFVRRNFAAITFLIKMFLMDVKVLILEI